MTVALGDRSLFPDLRPRAYLNHAAISPPSTAVREAVAEVLAASAALGAGAFRRWLEQRARLRQQLAVLLSAASADDIAFIPNTSRGVTDVALCLPWRSGDRVLLADGEFPANVTPWQRAAELFGLEVSFLPKPTAENVRDEWLAALGIALSRGVRLVALSAVQFQTGLRMPLGAIGALCQQHGAELFVDAIQACGVVPVDVRRDGIDYLATGSHKWLMGLEGAGMLYVASERAAALRPHVAGWLGHEDAFSFLFEGPGRLRYDRPLRRTAQIVEGGMANTVGLAALAASLGCIQELGVEAIFGHVSRYLDALEAALVERGFRSLRAREPELRSGILSVEPPAGVDVIELFRAIDTAAVSCTTPDGLLRFAPHWPNGLAEIDGVVGALEAALRAVGA
jgi:selenocysteine lyase/cysteine desulfurase